MQFIAVGCVLLVTLAIDSGPVQAKEAKQRIETQQDHDIYTSSWVVEVMDGRERMVDAMADKYGFKNLGKLKVYTHK